MLRSIYSLVAILALVPAARLSATHPVSDDNQSPLKCAVDGKQVNLSWDIHFFAPINGWIVTRDGVEIARLTPDANRFGDVDVPDGEHVYVLTAINFDDTEAAIGRCSVVVGDFGMRCEVQGSNVLLKWDELLIDIAFQHFVIRRDGEVIARVPNDQHTSLDVNVMGGRHRYTVHAEIYPGHRFVVGACTVRVSNPNFICRVDPPRVILDWSNVPLPKVPISFFLVLRNGEPLVRTLQTSLIDEPGRGEFKYEVFLVSSLAIDENINPATPIRRTLEVNTTIPTFLFPVGECKVAVPGGNVPPPEDLTCINLNLPPRVDLVNTIGDQLVGPSDVLLVWQQPVEYDFVVIARNGDVIARIDGSQLYYADFDVPAGNYVYSVFGVVDDLISPPSTCEVNLPFPPIEPPSNLQCRFIGSRTLDAEANFVDGVVPMRWVNGQAYDNIVIWRNGEGLVRLNGNAESYVDQNPELGVNKYQVFGVIGVRRSHAAECAVKVPIGRVPPPQDLSCVIVDGPIRVDPMTPIPRNSNDPINLTQELDSVGSVVPDFSIPVRVFLRWRNPVRYDRVVVTRNNAMIAILPGDTTSFRDVPPAGSDKIVYGVQGVIGDRRSVPTTCEVVLPPPFVPPPRHLRCGVVFTTLSDNPTSGDGLIVPAVKLVWENPFRYRGIVVKRDGLPIATLPGDAMVFRDVGASPGIHTYCIFGVGILNNSPKVCCDVDVPTSRVPPVQQLECHGVLTDVVGPVGILRWRNPIDYTSILIMRDGDVIEEIAGDANFYKDGPLEPGVYEYGVAGTLNGRTSRARRCTVVIHGPPPPNLLLFSSSLFDSANGTPPDQMTEDSDLVPLARPGRAMSFASNSRPVQAWSFGVCSDPSVMVPIEATINDTETAELNGGDGPDFVFLNLLDDGVVMAVVIDMENLEESLPVGSLHHILDLRYSPGPETKGGVQYPIRYCDRLGEPPVEVSYFINGFELRPDILPGSVFFLSPIQTGFIRSDANGDGAVDISDVIFPINWLFASGPAPGCMEAADSNFDGTVDLSDPIYTINFTLSGGPVPPPPYPDCGTGAAPLGCERSSCPATGNF